MTSLEPTTKFSSERFQMSIAGLAGVLYPFWYFINLAAAPASDDSFVGRLPISAFCFVSLAIMRLPRFSRALKNFCFLAGCWLVTAHALFLENANTQFPIYFSSTLVVIACTAACLPTRKSLVAYLLFCIAAILVSAHAASWTASGNQLIPFVVTIGGVIYGALSLRLKLTDKLAQTAEALDRIVHNAAAGIVFTDTKGEIVHINRRAAAALGYSAPELIGRSVLDVTHADERDQTAERLRRFANQELTEARLDRRVLARDGSTLWSRVYENSVFDAVGNVAGLISVAVDITKEKQLEYILNGQQRLLEMIAAGAAEDEVLRRALDFTHAHLDHQGIVVFKFDDSTGEIRPAHSVGVPAALIERLRLEGTNLGLFGISKVAAASRALVTALANDGDARWAHFFDAAAPFGIKAAFAVPVIARSGNMFGTFELFSTTQRPASTIEAKTLLAFAEIVGIMLEKSQSQKLIEAQQAKIAASAKMASLGEMAAGIAHEINNPLTIILGRSFMIRRYLEQPGFDRTDIDQACNSIEATVRRVTKIIQGLKTFARSDAGDGMAETQVAQIVADTLSFCSERFKNHGVELVVADIPAALTVFCRPTQISQVLLNLMSNAFDAVALTELKWVKLDCRDLGSMVELSVSDSGPGIEVDTEERIFQPFFSTKEVGKGSGLGLSISLGIAKDHGGSLTHDRHIGSTRFTLVLPLRSSDAMTATTSLPSAPRTKSA